MPNWWWFDAKKAVLSKTWWYLGVGEKELRRMFEHVCNRKPKDEWEFREWVRAE